MMKYEKTNHIVVIIQNTNIMTMINKVYYIVGGKK